MATLVPVDYDPFIPQPPRRPVEFGGKPAPVTLTPVDYDPFAAPKPKEPPPAIQADVEVKPEVKNADKMLPQMDPMTGMPFAPKDFGESASVAGQIIPGMEYYSGAANLGATDPESLKKLQNSLSIIAKKEKARQEALAAETPVEPGQAREVNTPQSPDMATFGPETVATPEGMATKAGRFAKHAAEGVAESAIPIGATMAATATLGPFGAIAGGGAAFGTDAYNRALINQTIKMGGDLNDAKQFNETYLKNKKAIDEYAQTDAAVNSLVGAAFGLVPGGGGLKGVASRLGVAYPSISTTGEATRRMMQNEPQLTFDEMAQMYGENLLVGGAFEAPHIPAAYRESFPRKPAEAPPAAREFRNVEITPEDVASKTGKMAEEALKTAGVEPSTGRVQDIFDAFPKFFVDPATGKPRPMQEAFDLAAAEYAKNPRPMEEAAKPEQPPAPEQPAAPEQPKAAETKAPEGAPKPREWNWDDISVLKEYGEPLEDIKDLSDKQIKGMADRIRKADPELKGTPLTDAEKAIFTTPAGEVTPPSKPAVEPQGAEAPPSPAGPAEKPVEKPPEKPVAETKPAAEAKPAAEKPPEVIIPEPPKKPVEEAKPAAEAPEVIIPEPPKKPVEAAPPAEKPVAEAKPAEPVKPAEPAPPAETKQESTNISYADAKDNPKLAVVEGHKYLPMSAGRFLTAISETPAFFNSNQVAHPDAIAAGTPIKISLDPAKLQTEGGKLSDGIGKAKDAIQQIIVSPNAFKPVKGNKEKKNQATEFNNNLHNVLSDLAKNHNVDVTIVREEGKIPRGVAKGHNTIIGFIRSYGGIKDTDFAEDKVGMPGIYSKDGQPFDHVFRAAAEEYFPNWDQDQAVGKHERDMLVDAVKNRMRHPDSPKKRPRDLAAEEAWQENQKRNQIDRVQAEKELLNLLDANTFGYKAEDIADILGFAINYMEERFSPIEALEAGLKKFDQQLKLSPEDMEYLFYDTPWFDAQAAQAASAARREALASIEKPTTEQKPETVSNGPQNVVKAETEEGRVKPVPEAEKPLEAKPEQPKTEEPKVEAPVEPKPEKEIEPVKEEKQLAPKELPAPLENKNSPFAKKAEEKNVGTRVIYDDGNVALLTTYDKYANRKYAVAKKGGRGGLTLLDRFKTNTYEAWAKLANARQQFIAEDSALFNENRDGPFKNGNFGASENTPKGLVNVLEGWAKLLGMNDARIYLTTYEDALKDVFHGPYASITGTAAVGLRDVGSGELGATRPLVHDGRIIGHVITIKPQVSKQHMLETLAHEFGHIVQKTFWDYAHPETRNEVLNAYEKWKAKVESGTVKQLLQSKQFLASNKYVEDYKNVPVKNSKYKDYHLSFGEWFADQTSRWAFSSEKPVSVVDKFFKRLADFMRNLWKTLKGEKLFPDKSFKNYMDGLVKDSVNPKVEDPNVNNSDDFNIDRSMSDKAENWLVPEYTFTRKAVRNLADRYNSANEAIKAVERWRGAPIPESKDFYLALSLWTDKAIDLQKQAWNKFVDPMIAYMTEHNIGMNEAGLFNYARHAPERNEYMAKRDPDRFNGESGSGMTTTDAKNYLDSIPKERYAQLEKLYDDYLRPMQKEALETLFNAGRMTQSEYDLYTKPRSEGGDYDYYVPLNGFAENEKAALDAHGKPVDIPNIGKGFKMGKDFFTAFGRETEARNPVLNTVNKLMDSIIRAEKNNVMEVLHNFILSYPNNGFATIIPPKDYPKVKTLQADGTVKMVPQFDIGSKDNILTVERFGLPSYMMFNDKSPFAMDVVNEFKAANASQMNALTKLAFQSGRLFSKVSTSLVPDFFLTNLPRDTMDALASIYAAAGPKAAAKFVAKDLPVAAAAMLAHNLGKDLTPTQKALIDRWKANGGNMDFGGFASPEQTQKALERKLFAITDKNFKNVISHYAIATAENAAKTLGFVNNLFEEAVRFGVFSAAVNAKNPDGTAMFSDAKAAHLARVATVDFRRTGSTMQYINALIPFTGAATGSLLSVYNLTQGTMVGGGYGKNQPGSKAKAEHSSRVRQIIYATLAASIANAMLGYLTSEPDDDDPTKRKYFTKVNGYERSKNIILPWQNKDGNYAKVASGFFINPITVLGDQIVGVATGNVKPQDAAMAMFQSVMNFVNVVTGDSVPDLVNALTPTVLRPGFEISRNADWLGNPIHPREENKGLARSQQARPGTEDTYLGQFSMWLADKLNSINGDKYHRGAMDYYPNDIQRWLRMFTGGVEKFFDQGFKAASNAKDGIETPYEKLPYTRRLVASNVKDEAKYYQAREKIKDEDARLHAALNDLKKNPRDAQALEQAKESVKKLGVDIKENKNGPYVSEKSGIPGALNEADKAVKMFNDAKKRVAEDKSLSPLQAKKQMDELDQRRRDILNRVRRVVVDYQNDRPIQSPLNALRQAIGMQ